MINDKWWMMNDELSYLAASSRPLAGEWLNEEWWLVDVGGWRGRGGRGVSGSNGINFTFRLICPKYLILPRIKSYLDFKIAIFEIKEFFIVKNCYLKSF